MEYNLSNFNPTVCCCDLFTYLKVFLWLVDCRIQSIVCNINVKIDLNYVEMS